MTRVNFAGLIPSEHTIVLAGCATAAILLASVLVARRDLWVTQLKAHRTLVRRAVIGALVVVVVALGIAHLDDLEHLVERVEQGDPAWLALGVGLEIVSFAGYVVLTGVVYRPRAPKLDWLACTAGVVARGCCGRRNGRDPCRLGLHRAGMETRASAGVIPPVMILLSGYSTGAILLARVLVARRDCSVPAHGPSPLRRAAIGASSWSSSRSDRHGRRPLRVEIRIPGDIDRRRRRVLGVKRAM